MNGKKRKRKLPPEQLAALWTPKQLADARKKWGLPEGKTRERLAAIITGKYKRNGNNRN